MGISGVALFPRLARYQNTLQTDIAGFFLGYYSTGVDDDSVYLILWWIDEGPFGGNPISYLQLYGTTSLDIIHSRGHPVKHQPSNGFSDDPEGIFPEVGYASLWHYLSPG